LEYPDSNIKYSSGVEACSANYAYYQQLNAAQYVSFEQVIEKGTASFTCRTYGLNRNPYSGQLQRYGSWFNAATRRGDSCPPDSNYDPETGGCVAPEEPNRCESTVGATINHEHKLRESVHGSDRVEPPGSVCANSCTYTFQYVVNNIYVYTSGTPSGVFGSYQYRGNGFECGEDTYNAPGNPGGTTNPDDTPSPDPDNNCPSGYVWNGTFCSKEPPKPCDPDVEVGGCDDTPPDNPDPGDGGDDGEGGDEEGDGDGNGDGSGGDGSGGDGDGSGGDSEGSGGDGNGDGKDEEEKPDSSVGGEACDSTLSCEGDAVQCAILRKQKEQVCMWQYGSLEKAQIETTLSGPDYELKEETLPVSGLFLEAVNKGRWLPQSCPSPERFTVMGRQFEMSYELICRFATALGPLLVVMASIFFAVYVGRAFKG